MSIRVLVVDDSAVMRGLLRMVLATSPEVDLVGVATDGLAGLEAVDRLNPDLILLDIEMPRMNGLEALAEIHARHPHVKVMMCSTLTRRGAGITLEALAHGATDYVTKPSSQRGARESIETLGRELLPKIRALFPARSINDARTGVARMPPHVAPRLAMRPSAGVLAVGVSTGGPAALEKFLPMLPQEFPLPVLVVQHMPPIFTALLAERLDGLCRVAVCEAESGRELAPGAVYIARGDWHMQAIGSAARCSLRLTQSAPEQYCRPSVDVMFRSAAAVYGASVIAVVLTGMGSDGVEGCRAIRAAGGRVLVQDRETSVVWGMPGAVAEAGLADTVLPLEAIAGEVINLTSRHAGRRPA